jgi:hypothetical protein
MIDENHFPALAQSAQAAWESLDEFVRVKRDSKASATLLSDELLYEFTNNLRAFRQQLIEAGCFTQHRITAFPLGGPAQAILLTVAADVGVEDRLPPEIETFLARLAELTRALNGREAKARTDPQESPVLPLLLSAGGLAKLINQPEARVETFLRRFRESNRDCVEEIPNPRRREPRYLYRTADVWGPLQERRKKWAKKTAD